jgi:hypothetical protein
VSIENTFYVKTHPVVLGGVYGTSCVLLAYSTHTECVLNTPRALSFCCVECVLWHVMCVGVLGVLD